MSGTKSLLTSTNKWPQKRPFETGRQGRQQERMSGVNTRAAATTKPGDQLLEGWNPNEHNQSDDQRGDRTKGQMTEMNPTSTQRRVDRWKSTGDGIPQGHGTNDSSRSSSER
mmetsp:Transcript_39249/g.82079  ORF Transcript_39249/g.82079 Transcript_39249/m.82079 type:complete len:112 (+) Transcript_39249:1373-1708(+)